MAEAYTKDRRQRIAEEFSTRHNGQYDSRLFLREVRETGETHPAYDWFTWDDGIAAEAHRLNEARAFVRGLTISFRVEEIETAPRRVTVATTAPAFISPVNNRANGGGYFAFRPDDPKHMDELARQAATALETWANRYSAAMTHLGRDRTTEAARRMAAEIRVDATRPRAIAAE